MKMRHTFLNKILGLVLMVLGYFLSAAYFVYSWDTSSYQQGITAGNNVQSLLGNSAQINNKLAAPLTSSTGSNISTLDGSQNFAAQLPATQSTDMFLDLFAAPGVTGDISAVTFREDTNFDGNADYAYSVSVPVSGVCKNGFISATPGTWYNLSYYTWTADASGRVTATAVPAITSLAGCYCINSSCGSNLVWNNLNLVLQDLATGIVAAVQAQTPLTITSVDTTQPTEVKYYGQNSGSMGVQTGFTPSGVVNPQQYFNGGTGTLPGNTELTNEATNPDSFFSKINNLNNSAGQQTTSQECNVKLQVPFASQTEMIGYDVSFYIGYDADGSTGNECFWAQTNGICQNIWSWNQMNWTDRGGNTTTCLMPNECTDSNLAHLGSIVSTIVFPTGQCVPYIDPGSGGSGCFPPPANLSISTYQFLSQQCSGYAPGCYGSDNNYTHQLWHIQAFTVSDPQDYYLQIQGNLVFGVKDTPQASSTGSCAGLDGDSQCFLQQETICDYNNSNCVYIYKNYNPTGLTPLTSCRQVTAPDTGQVWTFCVNGTSLTYQHGSDTGTIRSGTNIWWNINKIYSCQDNTVYNFSNVKQQTATIYNSLRINGTTANYNSMESAGNLIGLPPAQSTSPCEISCEVRVPAQDTQAGTGGNASQYLTSVNDTQTVIRLCQNNVCPVNTAAGETIIQSCGCRNYFNEATSEMQVLDNAGKDIICSSSPP